MKNDFVLLNARVNFNDDVQAEAYSITRLVSAIVPSLDPNVMFDLLLPALQEGELTEEDLDNLGEEIRFSAGVLGESKDVH